MEEEIVCPAGRDVVVERLLAEVQRREGMEAALIRASEEWRATFDASRDLIFLTDAAGAVVKANRAVAALLDRPFAEIIGRPVLALLGEAATHPGGDPLAATLASGRKSEGELDLASHGIRVEATADPVRDREGALRGAVLTLRDVTERRRAAAERQALEHQLHQMQKMDSIGRLAGGIAHDFNNMLSIVLGYGEMAAFRLEDGHSAAPALQTVMNAAERAAALTQQLLAFSRKQELTVKVLDLNAIVRHMTRMLGRILPANVHLEVQCAPPLRRVLADRSQLEQVVLNLVVNARDALPGGGRIRLTIADASPADAAPGPCPPLGPGDHVVLSVSDTGVGMPPEVRERIFEPFYTTKEEGKGTGLGLATVYGIVRQHGGCIGVESEPGRGTTFRIFLPATDEEPEPGLDAGSADTVRGTEGVLVVDDDRLLRCMVADALVPFGYRVLVACSAEEALETLELRAAEVDLVFSDIVLPGMSGRELAERVLARHCGIRVVLTSGDADQHEAWRSARPEVAFLPKPLQPTRFLRLIREQLDRRR